MRKIDEQDFETVNGLDIRCSFVASANTAEILIENQSFVKDRNRNLQHIVTFVLFWILSNIVIHQQAISILTNIVFVLIIAVKCYILANLIEFGKHFLCDS